MPIFFALKYRGKIKYNRMTIFVYLCMIATVFYRIFKIYCKDNKPFYDKFFIYEQLSHLEKVTLFIDSFLMMVLLAFFSLVIYAISKMKG